MLHCVAQIFFNRNSLGVLQHENRDTQEKYWLKIFPSLLFYQFISKVL